MRSLSIRKRLSLLLSLLLSIPAVIPASAAQQTFDLPQAVAYALQQNGELGAFREEKGIRDAGKTRAGLLPNPTLELEAGTGALTGSSAENNQSLGVSQEFILAGKREKRLTIAAQELEMYRWQLADRERLLAEEVKTAFTDVILAGQRIALSDRSTQLNRQLLDVAQERLAAGDIPELEMNLVRVELARSEGTRIDAERALLQNQAKLWLLMGLAPDESPSFIGALETQFVLTLHPGDLTQLARVKRPDLKALDAEKSRGEADMILARAEGMPNLTAGLALKRDTTAMEVGGIEGKDSAYTIGLRLSLPIPLFDKNQAAVQEATARKSSSEYRLAAATRKAEREVAMAHGSLLNAEKILALYKRDIIPQLEENLTLTQEAYRLGEVGILAVFQEQKKFFEVSEGYLTALYDRQKAIVKLETAVATDLSGGVQ